jgi:signal transduction histidine kinase
VDDHELAHLFDKHFRGEQAQLKSQEGSGLGLATVKAFVTELNGGIEIDKSELGGLKCVLRFPL